MIRVGEFSIWQSVPRAQSRTNIVLTKQERGYLPRGSKACGYWTLEVAGMGMFSLEILLSEEDSVSFSVRTGSI